MSDVRQDGVDIHIADLHEPEYRRLMAYYRTTFSGQIFRFVCGSEQLLHCSHAPRHRAPPDATEWRYGTLRQALKRNTDCHWTGRYFDKKPVKNFLQELELNSYTSAQEQNFANWFSFYRTRVHVSKAGVSEAFSKLPPTYRLGYGSINSNTIYGVRPFSSRADNFYSWLADLSPNGGTPLRQALERAGNYYENNDEPWRINPSSSSSDLLSCRQNFTVMMTDGYWSGGSPNGDIGDYDSDTREVTLADVAYYYWRRDLRSNLRNDVPASPANWQHMVTLGLSFGVGGTPGLKEEALQVLNSCGQTADCEALQDDVNWPNPMPSSNDGWQRIDDLLHAAVNSRGNYFSSQNPQEFVEGLDAIIASIKERPGSGTSLASSTTGAGDFVYASGYTSVTWDGYLKAYSVNADGGLENVIWESSFPAHTERKILTRRDSDGATIEVKWDGLSDTLRSLLSSSGVTEEVLDYLRGDRTKERISLVDTNENRPYRFRGGSVLGGIINSSPVFIPKVNPDKFKTFNWSELSSYESFAEGDAGSRAEVIYTGANDGMLHAFYTGNGPEAGEEVFAYIPSFLLDDIGVLSDPDYVHRYFIDGDLTAAEVYVAGSWKTVLVGTLGRGGEGIFVLDVTDPTSPQVLYEYDGSSYTDIGKIIGKPTITRLEDGSWVVLLGNGYNSSSHDAKLLKIDLSTGVLTSTTIASGSAANPNGLGSPFAWDSDQSGAFDLVYAADYQGDVWAIDISSSSVTSRKVFDGYQAITAPVFVTKQPDTSYTWIFVGTGRFLSEDDIGNTGVQTWYGFKDPGAGVVLDRSDLKERTITAEIEIAGFDARTVSSASSGDMAGKQGWFMDLVVGGNNQGERMVFQNRIVGNVLLGSTLLPVADPCQPGGTGYLMSIDAFTGAGLEDFFFDYSGDGQYGSEDKYGDSFGSGISFGAIPSVPVIVNGSVIVQQENTQIGETSIIISGGSGLTIERILWREMTGG
ncbi:pilus assembly protein [Marinobacterium iners]|uniref:pilus assembly protein n=1 Tax=Marinobacterium iners TaxID=48076 RepID=UPI001A8F4C50|nr:PilC/PilY family type IV pilus protein [Marinobacterium iners]